MQILPTTYYVQSTPPICLNVMVSLSCCEHEQFRLTQYGTRPDACNMQTACLRLLILCRLRNEATTLSSSSTSSSLCICMLRGSNAALVLCFFWIFNFSPSICIEKVTYYIVYIHVVHLLAEWLRRRTRKNFTVP